MSFCEHVLLAERAAAAACHFRRYPSCAMRMQRSHDLPLRGGNLTMSHRSLPSIMARAQYGHSGRSLSCLVSRCVPCWYSSLRLRCSRVLLEPCCTCALSSVPAAVWRTEHYGVRSCGQRELYGTENQTPFIHTTSLHPSSRTSAGGTGCLDGRVLSASADSIARAAAGLTTCSGCRSVRPTVPSASGSRPPGRGWSAPARAHRQHLLRRRRPTAAPRHKGCGRILSICLQMRS